MSLCSLLLSLETPNAVQSVALESQNSQATNKGSDQTGHISEALLVAHTTLLEISRRGSINFKQFCLFDLSWRAVKPV